MVSIRAQLQLTRNCPKIKTVNFPGLADQYRADFPILSQEVNGHPLVYLDNAASTQRPTAVIEELARYYREDHANVHRGLHTLSNRATALYEKARAAVAHYLNAKKAESIVFLRVVPLKGSTWSLKVGGVGTCAAVI